MKPAFTLLLFCCLLAGWTTACATPATPEPAATPTAVPPTPTPAPVDVVSKLHWFGTSAILYNGPQVIYFDPVTLSGTLPTADLVLVSHGHSDHWSVNDLKKIIGPDTKLVISPSVSTAYEKAKDELGIAATILAEGEKTEVNGVSIEAVPAFDTHAHLRENGGVGYIVSVDHLRIYHAGGTNSYPEMAQYAADIAILPLYKTDDLMVMMGLIPAKVFVVGHTSYYTVKAVAKLAADTLAKDQRVADLELGPFEP